MSSNAFVNGARMSGACAFIEGVERGVQSQILKKIDQNIFS